MTILIPRRYVLLTAALCAARTVVAQTGIAANPGSGETPTLSIVGWLRRMHAASQQHNYVGTFVVIAEAGELSSARIWHVPEGDLPLERIESLSGPPRLTFRRNQQVLTFLPESHKVRSEKHENLELFPSLSVAPGLSIVDFYAAQVLGKDRVADFDADVVQFNPKDNWRFGYRIWSERRSGLMVKLQILDGKNKVIEQSAFSELRLDVPIDVAALTRMMGETAGYQIQTSELERTTAQHEGWALKERVKGFQPVDCYQRPASGDAPATTQWIFSDGLASVSLFLESYDAKREPKEVLQALGATYTLTHRLPDKSGDWWLTAVGEVPPQTLGAFAQALERVR